MRLQDYNKTVVILPIVLVSSIILGIISYNYFTQTANQIQELAIDELKTNSEIEAYSISNSLSNAMYAIISNLEIIANSPSTIEGNTSATQTLLNIGLDSTNNLTDGYYFLDENGMLMTFTGIEKEENSIYKGVDLSHRNYFQVPKQNGTLYTSTVIDSNDNVPRIYISMPILENNQTRISDSSQGKGQSNANLTSFKGVVVASIEAKTLGNFLEGQIHPKFDGNVGFIDRDGTMIYTQNQTFIGKNYFGVEFQSYLKSILKDKEEGFNSIISKSLNSDSGVDEFSFENTSTTIAYEAVMGPQASNNNDEYGNRVGTLFITVPHTLAGDVASLIDNQRITNFSIISLIAAISTIIAIILLKWNRILKDIVNQKTFQLRETIDKLKKANEDLKLHDNMQKEFINIAAHELRTPTQAISGNLELIEIAYLPSLLQESSSTEQNGINEEFENLVKDRDKLQEFRNGLVSTYRNSERLEKLVNGILDISRIESKGLELHKEYFNLNEEIRNVIKDVHKKNTNYSHLGNSSKNIDFEFKSSEDPITVFADKIRMFEVLSNLINNAIKFSNDEPITISSKKVLKKEIETHLHHKKEGSIINTENKDEEMKMMAVVSIRDKGKGIDSDILPRLFTKFATKSNQGTGLGLYISKSIIEAHGGQIWAQNNYDNEKGATFSFSLPLN